MRRAGRQERTRWGFLVALAALALLGASMAMPWWTYKFSTGPQAPPGGPQPENETFVERERLDFYPYRTQGHSNNTTAGDVARVVRVLGHLVLAPAAILGLVALVEFPVPLPLSTRWITLPLLPVGFLSTLGALLWSWFRIPPLLATATVDRVFTTHPVADGFVQTWLFLGWVAAGLALLGFPAVFAFKYQAGATDPTVIEHFRKAPRRP